MRLKNLIITLGLSLTAVGAAVGGAKALSNSKKTDAISATTEQTIYLKPGVWNVDSAQFAIYAYGEGHTWSSFMEPVEDDEKTFFTTLDLSNKTHIIAVRLNSKLAEPSFDGAWNQTSNIEIGNFNCVEITGWSQENFETSNYTEPDHDKNWYIVGSGSFVEEEWHRIEANKLTVTDKMDDYDQYTITLDLKEGDLFKFRKQGTWVGYDSKESGEGNAIGDGRSIVKAAEDSDNFKVTADGNYSFFLKYKEGGVPEIKVWANKNEAPKVPTTLTLHFVDGTTNTVNDLFVGDEYTLDVVLGGWSTTPAPYFNPVTLINGKLVLTENAHLYEQEFGRDNCIYFGQKDWGNTYVYSFGNNANGQKVEPYGEFPGTPVTSFADGVNFNGLGLAKVEVNAAIEKNVIFSNFGANQTADLTVNAGHYYTMNDTDVNTEYTGSIIDGIAAAFVYRFNEARLALDNGSICGLVDNSSLKNEYNALSQDAKDIVANTTIFTYSGSTITEESKINVLMSDMMRVLGYDVSVVTTSFLGNINNDSSVIIILLVISAITACGIGFYFLKRRKHA